MKTYIIVNTDKRYNRYYSESAITPVKLCLTVSFATHYEGEEGYNKAIETARNLPGNNEVHPIN